MLLRPPQRTAGLNGTANHEIHIVCMRLTRYQGVVWRSKFRDAQHTQPPAERLGREIGRPCGQDRAGVSSNCTRTWLQTRFLVMARVLAFVPPGATPFYKSLAMFFDDPRELPPDNNSVCTSKNAGCGCVSISSTSHGPRASSKVATSKCHAKSLITMRVASPLDPLRVGDLPKRTSFRQGMRKLTF